CGLILPFGGAEPRVPNRDEWRITRAGGAGGEPYSAGGACDALAGARRRSGDPRTLRAFGLDGGAESDRGGDRSVAVLRRAPYGPAARRRCAIASVCAGARARRRQALLGGRR